MEISNGNLPQVGASLKNIHTNILIYVYKPIYAYMLNPYMHIYAFAYIWVCVYI